MAEQTRSLWSVQHCCVHATVWVSGGYRVVGGSLAKYQLFDVGWRTLAVYDNLKVDRNIT
jgi:hypothetical protein